MELVWQAAWWMKIVSSSGDAIEDAVNKLLSIHRAGSLAHCSLLQPMTPLKPLLPKTYVKFRRKNKNSEHPKVVRYSGKPIYQRKGERVRIP